MNSKVLHLILSIVGIFALAFLICAFSQASFDIASWPRECRAAGSMGIVFCCLSCVHSDTGITTTMRLPKLKLEHWSTNGQCSRVYLSGHPDGPFSILLKAKRRYLICYHWSIYDDCDTVSQPVRGKKRAYKLITRRLACMVKAVETRKELGLE